MPPDCCLLVNEQEKMLALAQLFRDAGHAHHRAFLATNGDDPEWPRWYAEQLAPRMEVLLGRRFWVPELAECLRELEERRKAMQPTPDWPMFYAEFFVREAR